MQGYSKNLNYFEVYLKKSVIYLIIIQKNWIIKIVKVMYSNTLPKHRIRYLQFNSFDPYL